MANEKRLTCIDLFAGCGGLSLGLEQAGFSPLFTCELNEHALQTYLMNRAQSHPHLLEAGFHCQDIKTLTTKARALTELNSRIRNDFGIEKGEVDLLVGGPPCQGFSGIGHRRSYSVDKEQLPSNHLFEDMAHMIHRVRPRAFLFENVRGLLNAKWTSDGVNGEIFQDVVATFENLKNYRIAWKLVFAKDYGVPQNRPRVLLVGLRKDVVVPNEVESLDAVERGFLPKPVSDAAPSIEDLYSDLVDPNYCNGGATKTYPSEARTKIQKQLRRSQDGRRIARMGDALTEHEYSKHSPSIVEKFKAMLVSPTNEIPEQFRTKKFAQRVLPRTWGDTGPSITATSLPDDYVHYGQPRSLTVREWARLQMFPDWYQFAGKRTTGGLRRAGNPREGIFDREVPKYTQIGNAVPVELARAVGQHLAGILKKAT